MIVLFADTPDDMRREILKMVDWLLTSETASGKAARPKSTIDRLHTHSVGVLKLLKADIERGVIMPVAANKRPEPTPTLPLINLNGSNPKSMVEDICDALRGLEEARRLLGRIAPHGRDYQGASEGRYDAARAEHVRRVDTLERMALELTTLAQGIQAQQRS